MGGDRGRRDHPHLGFDFGNISTSTLYQVDRSPGSFQGVGGVCKLS